MKTEQLVVILKEWGFLEIQKPVASFEEAQKVVLEYQSKRNMSAASCHLDHGLVFRGNDYAGRVLHNGNIVVKETK
jgi:hypothetical protein